MPTLPDYLLKAAKKYPAQTAIEANSSVLTYQEYADEAKRIATLILQLDNSPNANIAVCLPKTFDLYKSIFGISFANKCIVPISYLTPIDRARYILTDSNSSLFITTVDKLQKIIQSNHLDHDKNESVLASLSLKDGEIILESVTSLQQQPATDMSLCLPNSDEPSYLLYTSGSTGLPKGILHTHQSATVFIDWAHHYLSLTEKDIVAHKSSIDFDLSTFDIFATVSAGAKLIPLPENLFNYAPLLIKFILKNQITIFYSVPSSLLNDTIDFEKLSATQLRHLIFAGEPINKSMAEKLYQFLPDSCLLHNWYGPTETNVCGYYQITADSFKNEEEIPLGKPCPYAHFDLKSLPNTQHAELLIQSDSTMKSYWKQPMIDRATYYHSGDLTSMNSNHEYLYHGRMDRQIKHQGYRIQLEEIEMVALSHHDILESAALYVEEQIILFVSLKSQNENVNLNIHFSSKLPKYAHPDLIFALDELPRTLRGKIDYPSLQKYYFNQKSS